MKCIGGLFSCFSTSESKPESEEDEKTNDPRNPAKARTYLEVASWEKVTKTIVASIKEGLEKYEREHTEHEHVLDINMTNLLAIFSEVR